MLFISMQQLLPIHSARRLPSEVRRAQTARSFALLRLAVDLAVPAKPPLSTHKGQTGDAADPAHGDNRPSKTD